MKVTFLQKKLHDKSFILKVSNKLNNKVCNKVNNKSQYPYMTPALMKYFSMRGNFSLFHVVHRKLRQRKSTYKLG